MAQCKWCGRSGWFLYVTGVGLCNNCNTIVTMDLKQRGRIIDDSVKIVQESKNLGTRLARCDLIFEHASALIKYQQAGILTLKTLPSTLIEDFRKARDQIILETLEADFANARSKLDTAASSVKAKLNLLSKVLLRIREFKPKANDSKLLDSLEEQLSQLIHGVQLAGYLDEARKAEFKGQKKKALDQYYEALYFLKHDQIDDSLQQEHIGFIESKIGELGGTPA